MEQPSLEEDRPYARPEPPSFPWVEAVLAIVLTAGTIYLFYYFQAGREPSPVPAVKNARRPFRKPKLRPRSAIRCPRPMATRICRRLPTATR
jgi:hypothetical protein